MCASKYLQITRLTLFSHFPRYNILFHKNRIKYIIAIYNLFIQITLENILSTFLNLHLFQRIKRAIPFPRLPTTPPIILHKACSNNDLEPRPTSSHLTSAILVHLCTAVDDDLVREMFHPRFGTVLMSLWLNTLIYALKSCFSAVHYEASVCFSSSRFNGVLSCDNEDAGKERFR